MYERKVTIRDLETKQEQEIIVTGNTDEPVQDMFMYTDIDGVHIECRGSFGFQILKKLRDKLLSMGYGMKCCGAMLNAVQTLLYVEVDLVHLVELGKSADRSNLKHILDYAEIDSFPDTKQQDEFTENFFVTNGSEKYYELIKKLYDEQ